MARFLCSVVQAVRIYRRRLAQHDRRHTELILGVDVLRVGPCTEAGATASSRLAKESSELTD
jgi:hypothetical protein